MQPSKSFITNSIAGSRPSLPLPKLPLEETIETDLSTRLAQIKMAGEEDVAEEEAVAEAEAAEAVEVIEDVDEDEEDMDGDTPLTIPITPTHKVGRLTQGHIPMTNGII